MVQKNVLRLEVLQPGRAEQCTSFALRTDAGRLNGFMGTKADPAAPGSR